MSAKTSKSTEQAELKSLVRRDLDHAIEKVMERSFIKFRSALVQQLLSRMREHLTISGPGDSPQTQSSVGEWVGIESLSRLRSVVGGRFQNIKKKWTDAGFPLREHRGDRIKGFTIKDHAWVDLSNWILKQGYEARLTPESNEFLFELRAIK